MTLSSIDGASSVGPGVRSAGQYLSPAGYNAFCSQTYFRMKRPAAITLDAGLGAHLDASALFAEAKEDEALYRQRLVDIYEDVLGMRAQDHIQYRLCVSGIREHPADHMRMVWHFAGSCAAGNVVDPADFSVMGTKGLHVVDMSACRVCPDGGGMSMAYLTGHMAAAQMHK